MEGRTDNVRCANVKSISYYVIKFPLNKIQDFYTYKTPVYRKIDKNETDKLQFTIYKEKIKKKFLIHN